MKLLRWVADAPRFVEVNSSGKPTGRSVGGTKARMLQYELDTGKSLPKGWIRDWSWENRGPAHVGEVLGRRGVTGRRHAFFVPRSEGLRIVTPEEVESAKGWFDRAWPDLKWHPLSKTYVWSSHVWNWTTEVEDDDAPLIFYGCYGEFRDISHLVIQDDLRAIYTAGSAHI